MTISQPLSSLRASWISGFVIMRCVIKMLTATTIVAYVYPRVTEFPTIWNGYLGK